MKTKLLTLTLLIISLGAFAQGNIGMVNDSTRLVYFANTLAADAALMGQKVPLNGLLPSGKTLIVDLYAGPTAGTMTLQQTTVFSASILGGFGPRNFTSANIAGGATYTAQIKIRDNTYATAELAYAAGSYVGYSQIFTARASSTIAYFNINNTTAANAQSTWAPGTVPLPGGGFGAIMIGPEPSSAALAGLGGAILFFFRRRK